MDESKDDWSDKDEAETPLAPFVSNPVPNAHPNVVKALDALRDYYTTTPLANHPATASSTWGKIERGDWNTAMRGWFDKGTGDAKRRIILLGETHNEMEHFVQHMFEDKATRIWEKNLYVYQAVNKRKNFKAWHDRFTDAQRRYFDTTLAALQRDEAEDHILDPDSDTATQAVTQALKSVISADTSELIGRLIAADAEIYDVISNWIDSAEPTQLEHLALKRRRWRYCSVLVGAQHYNGVKHYITTLGGFQEVIAGPSLILRALQD
ncbi:hypothetical protein LZ198_28130 [Myxococcus sp. K15C18031901]|uniref:hypothetical protein n=1 Tax=Myxococcus dinghuensis TaxID=2906761 RepID=UPI0020A7FA09|nr:hypothetical protein [Myxococcus dinghuensis]MCP3102751.1 hypothetical protein [Myxococcus dinghuensis]